MTLPSWHVAYAVHRERTAFIDIETTGWNGPIAVLGVYRAQNGKLIQLVRGVDLTTEAVTDALRDVTLIVTFNGAEHDIPKLQAEFPKVFQAWRTTVDLFEVASHIGLRSGLKRLERTFHIPRPEWMRDQRHIAVELWRHHFAGDASALPKLLEYNASDTVNLLPLAEELARQTDELVRYALGMATKPTHSQFTPDSLASSAVSRIAAICASGDLSGE